MKHNGKHYLKQQVGTYEVVVQDYGYTSRPPVSVRVSGTTLGECTNMSGEPCYFYKSDEAMSMAEGTEKARAIVAARVA